MTSGVSPIAVTLSRYLLEHGDYVVLGVMPTEFEHPERGSELKAFLDEIRAEDGDDHYHSSVFHHGDDDGDTVAVHDPTSAGGSSSSTGVAAGAASASRPRQKPWRERVRPVALDSRLVSQCQAAVAEAVDAFGRIDIMLGCTNEALVGTVEELGQSPRALSLVQDQFETVFFSNVNLIRAVLPTMRAQKNGHLIVISGITGHLGTPGLGLYCAAQWAVEGYCDSLAYEIAPFNIKMTIVQPNVEIGVLTNRVTAVPPLPPYMPDTNPAPLFREILSGLLDRISDNPSSAADLPTPASASASVSMTSPSAASEPTPPQHSSNMMDSSSGMGGTTMTAAHHASTPNYSQGELLNSSQVISLFPTLSSPMRAALIAETVFALAAIGGHDNPPARHIVGLEGVNSVKEKLKTVSEELEDFVEVSSAVDYY